MDERERLEFVHREQVRQERARQDEALLLASQWYCPACGTQSATRGFCLWCAQNERAVENAREAQRLEAQRLAHLQQDVTADVFGLMAAEDASAPAPPPEDPAVVAERADMRARAEQTLREADSAASSAARREFREVRDVYADWLGVDFRGQVHHAIELRVLDLFPGAFSADELNDFENMRGIPRELTKEELATGSVELTPRSTRMQLHNAAIRERWDRAYVALLAELEERRIGPDDDLYVPFVRRYLEDARDTIDHTLGMFFTESRASRFDANDKT